MMDENILASKFPQTFKKPLKTLLFKTMRDIAPQAKKYFQDEFSGLPKMRDFDWRLDIKTASKHQERMKQPVLYVKLDLEGQGNADSFEPNKQVLFQVSKGQLKEILNNFETINTQLQALTASTGQ